MTDDVNLFSYNISKKMTIILLLYNLKLSFLNFYY